MSQSFDQLFEIVMHGGPPSVAALDEFVAMGSAALAPLVAIMERGRGAYVAAAILSFLGVPDKLAVIAPLAMHPSADVRQGAIAALARTGDPRAAAVLADVYAKHGHLFTIIRALGNLGVVEALAPLRGIIAASVGDPTQPAVLSELTALAIEDLDPSDLFVITYGAASLAKLGDLSLVGAACELTRFAPAEEIEFQEAGQIRLEAVHALDVSVGPNIAATLDHCCTDPDREVAEAALRATLHLGRIRSVARWLAALASPDDRIAYSAQYCLQQLTGERPPDDWKDAVKWWGRIKRRFDPEKCYRLGELASPGVLVGGARGPGSAAARMELQQMTGLGFIAPSLTPPAPAETAAIDAWWNAHASEFPPGKLHRWGRTYEPGACD